MDKVFIFKGSNRDFTSYLEEKGISDNYTPFMELIRQHDASNSQNVREGTKSTKIENLVICAEDYSSVNEHVITNFSNIVMLDRDIGNIFIQNPPKRVESSVKAEFGHILEVKHSIYENIAKNQIMDFYNWMMSSKIVGQHRAKKEVSIGFLKHTTLNKNSPLVFLFYGKSGVGKTEMAKRISEYFKGKLTRIQFSMIQTEEAYKYIFGDVHGKNSLAKDLLARETNIVLIDEFDKVNPGVYSVFYQMFDEGKLEDINYSIDVSNCIFILTTNFLNESEIADRLGLPIFSRIDFQVQFQKLTKNEIIEVINNEFDNALEKLPEEDGKIIIEYGLREKYISNVDSFENIRLLGNFIERDIFEILFDSLDVH